MPSRAGRPPLPFSLKLEEGDILTGTLRRSPRVKHVRLIVNENGLTVTAPGRFSPKDLPSILERHREWILQSLEKMQPRLASKSQLPDRVVLPALGEIWLVELREGPASDGEGLARAVTAGDWGTLPTGTLYLPRELAIPALKRWLLRRAQETLPPLLRELAVEFQTPAVKRICVKNQKTRLGSCSSRGNINLNARLLFLRPDLVRHIMLHELCHLLEMNHGQEFHRHLHDMDPETDRHRAELRAAWREIPVWAIE